MRFGICTGVENAPALKAAGWDFVEENVQGILQGELPDEKWQGDLRADQSALPVIAANCLVPGSLKITGTAVDLSKLRAYMTNVLKRAKRVGMKSLVFGSAGARNLPEGFDRDKGRRQILDFVKMALPIAQENGVTIVCEPLNRREANVITSVTEAMTYVKEVNHPNFQCLVDAYHFWDNEESLESLRDAMPWIRHVHLADKDGRVAPGESGTADYRPFFKVLKQGKYEGPLSVEAGGVTFDEMLPRVLKFVKQQWAEA